MHILRQGLEWGAKTAISTAPSALKPSDESGKAFTHHRGNGPGGAYLASYLLRKGYQVLGTYRRLSTLNFPECNESTYPSLLREIPCYVDVTQQSAIPEVGWGHGLLIEQLHGKLYRNMAGCNPSTGLIEQAGKRSPDALFLVTDAANLTMFPGESYNLV